MPTQNDTTQQDATDTTAQTDTTQQQADATPVTFESWITSQPEEIKALVNGRFTALENTVAATRTERDTLKTQVKNLAKTQAEGSEARKALDEISVKLEQSDRRADFLEAAIDPVVQCRNPRAAWVIAQAKNAFDASGKPDWAVIKAEAPELFGVAIGNANPGAGTGEKPKAQKQSMNSFIRAAAGRTQ